jgi:hypothetical protein
MKMMMRMMAGLVILGLAQGARATSTVVVEWIGTLPAVQAACVAGSSPVAAYWHDGVRSLLRLTSNLSAVGMPWLEAVDVDVTAGVARWRMCVAVPPDAVSKPASGSDPELKVIDIPAVTALFAVCLKPASVEQCANEEADLLAARINAAGVDMLGEIQPRRALTVDAAQPTAQSSRPTLEATFAATWSGNNHGLRRWGLVGSRAIAAQDPDMIRTPMQAVAASAVPPTNLDLSGGADLVVLPLSDADANRLRTLMLK